MSRGHISPDCKVGSVAWSMRAVQKRVRARVCSASGGGDRPSPAQMPAGALSTSKEYCLPLDTSKYWRVRQIPRTHFDSSPASPFFRGDAVDQPLPFAPGCGQTHTSPALRVTAAAWMLRPGNHPAACYQPQYRLDAEGGCPRRSPTSGAVARCGKFLPASRPDVGSLHPSSQRQAVNGSMGAVSQACNQQTAVDVYFPRPARGYQSVYFHPKPPCRCAESIFLPRHAPGQLHARSRCRISPRPTPE